MARVPIRYFSGVGKSLPTQPVVNFNSTKYWLGIRRSTINAHHYKSNTIRATPSPNGPYNHYSLFKVHTSLPIIVFKPSGTRPNTPKPT